MENTFTDDTVDMRELVKRYREDNSFVFYASFYEGIRTLAPEVQLEVYDALCRYGCRGEFPGRVSRAASCVLMFCLPQIEAAQSRYERACNGGGRKGVCNNPTGRRGKKNMPADYTPEQELKQELKEQTEKQNPKTQLTELQSEKQTEKTNSELNKNKQETKNRLNIEIEKEIKEEIEIKKQIQLQQQKEIETEFEKQQQEQTDTTPEPSESVADDGDARRVFIDDYFAESRLPVIERQAGSLGVTMAGYRSLVEQVLDDWEMSSQIPSPTPDERRHMLYTVRKKHEAQQSQAARRRTQASRSSASPQFTNDTLERGRRSYEERMEAERRERAEMNGHDVLRGEALAAKLDKFDLRTGQYKDTPPAA